MRRGWPRSWARILQRATDSDVAVNRAVNEFSTQDMNATTVAAEDRQLEAAGQRAADLAAIPNPTDAQLAELERLLDVNAADPTFGTALHRDLGAEGLTLLLVDLGETPSDLGPDGSPLPRRELDVEQQTDLQRLLGTSLAVATDPAREPSLDPEYLNEFQQAGREQYPGTSGVPGPYGYQYLAPLLHHGDFSSEFLRPIGADIVRMEQADPGLWSRGLHQPGTSGMPVLAGASAFGGAWDPLEGVLSAVSRDSQTSADFFSGWPLPGDPVEYMIERDAADSPFDDSDYYSHHLGAALEAGALNEPRSPIEASIAERTINVLGSQPANDTSATGDIDFRVPPEMRDNVGRILESYIVDVNATVGEYGSGQPHPAEFNGGDLRRVLHDVSYDPDVYQDLYDTQRAYLAFDINEAVARGESPAIVGERAGEGAQVLATLDNGFTHGVESLHLSSDAEANAILERQKGFGNFAIGQAAGLLPGGGILGDLLAIPATEFMNQQIDQNVQNSSGDANEIQANTREASRNTVDQLVEQALWDAGELPNPPAELLREDGSVIPLAEMTEAQFEHYAEYRDSPDYRRTLTPARDAAGEGYSDGVRFGDESRGES